MDYFVYYNETLLASFAYSTDADRFYTSKIKVSIEPDRYSIRNKDGEILS